MDPTGIYNIYTIQRVFENKLCADLVSTLKHADDEKTGLRSYSNLIELRESRASVCGESPAPPTLPPPTIKTTMPPSGVDTPATPLELGSNSNLESGDFDDGLDHTCDLTLRLVDLVTQLKGTYEDESCTTKSKSAIHLQQEEGTLVAGEGELGSYGAWILSPDDFKRRMSAARASSSVEGALDRRTM